MFERPGRASLLVPLLFVVSAGATVWLQAGLDVGLIPIEACAPGTEDIVGLVTIELPVGAVETTPDGAERPSDPSRAFCRARGVAQGEGDAHDVIEEWQSPIPLPVRLADGRLVTAPRATWSPFRGASIDGDRARLYRAGSSFRSSTLEEQCLSTSRPLDVEGCLTPDGTLSGRGDHRVVFFPEGRHRTRAAFWGGLLALALALASLVYGYQSELRWLRPPPLRRWRWLGPVAGLALIVLWVARAPWGLWLAAFAWLHLLSQVVRGWNPAANVHAKRRATLEPILRGHFEDDAETRSRSGLPTAAFFVSAPSDAPADAVLPEEARIYTLRDEDLGSDDIASSASIADAPDGELYVTGARLVDSAGEYRAEGRPNITRRDAAVPIGLYSRSPRGEHRESWQRVRLHLAATCGLAAFGVLAAGALATLLVRLLG